MASHNETGKQREELAARWLKEHGYEQHHCNRETEYFWLEDVFF